MKLLINESHKFQNPIPCVFIYFFWKINLNCKRKQIFLWINFLSLKNDFTFEVPKVLLDERNSMTVFASTTKKGLFIALSSIGTFVVYFCESYLKFFSFSLKTCGGQAKFFFFSFIICLRQMLMAKYKQCNNFVVFCWNLIKHLASIQRSCESKKLNLLYGRILADSLTT